MKSSCLGVRKIRGLSQKFQNCPADGSTYHNVEVVIQGWLETAKELGRSIPEPKGGSFLPEEK
jgi:hypothetical protein